MSTSGGLTLSPVVTSSHTQTYLLQRRVQVLALLHFCCAVGRGRGGAHGVVDSKRRISRFSRSACAEAGGQAVVRLARLHPCGMDRDASEYVVGCGGLGGHTKALTTSQDPSVIIKKNGGRHIYRVVGLLLFYAPKQHSSDNKFIPFSHKHRDTAVAGQKHNTQQRAWSRAFFLPALMLASLTPSLFL
jgi:hypothetical protein